MTSRESITQATSIAEADRHLSMQSVVVRAGDGLDAVAEAVGANPGCRVVSVVDDDGRLVGVLPVHDLVDDIFLKVVPEQFLGHIGDYEEALEYARRIGLRTAGDAMREPVAVSADDTVRDAFERMHAADLHGLPIVDAERRVIGYVDQLELLLVWLRATGQSGLLHPSDEGEAPA